MRSYHALALFSGGLDSLLAAKTIQAQGLSVLGLHFTSPFFGKPHKIDHWREIYGLDIIPVDVADAYVAMETRFTSSMLWLISSLAEDCSSEAVAMDRT